MRVLVTSSRTPFAIDAIRKLAEAGHDVWAADVYDASPGSHSKYLKGHFTTPEPDKDAEAFIDSIEKIATETELDMVLPAFEEAFYMATQHERLDEVATIFTGRFPALARLHDKGTFKHYVQGLGLPVPETIVARDDAELKEATGKWEHWFARAAFSRGGVGLLTNTGPLAAKGTVEDIHPTAEEPWLVQPFVDGPMLCTYSIVHGGEVASHIVYRAPRQWQHSTAIEFESIDGQPTLDIVNVMVKDMDYTGQLSFDFVDGEDGLTLIECNPRMTDGMLMVNSDELSTALFNPPAETHLIEPGRTLALDFAVFADMFTHGIKEMPGSIHELRTMRDPASGWHDHMPAFYNFLALAHHAGLSLKEHKGIYEAMADGMTWDGQPIPGMSDADAKALADLESSA
ncbi:MAG: carbamoyl-phosphate synthase large subunit [Thermoleophilaceae bacterium]|nr:carbamoyl-phosphate synthase large subunit [Thermoleophilaceae bacterium]